MLLALLPVAFTAGLAVTLAVPLAVPLAVLFNALMFPATVGGFKVEERVAGAGLGNSLLGSSIGKSSKWSGIAVVVMVLDSTRPAASRDPLILAKAVPSVARICAVASILPAWSTRATAGLSGGWISRTSERNRRSVTPRGPISAESNNSLCRPELFGGALCVEASKRATSRHINHSEDVLRCCGIAAAVMRCMVKTSE